MVYTNQVSIVVVYSFYGEKCPANVSVSDVQKCKSHIQMILLCWLIDPYVEIIDTKMGRRIGQPCPESYICGKLNADCNTKRGKLALMEYLERIKRIMDNTCSF